jgi:hypothetical protein
MFPRRCFTQPLTKVTAQEWPRKKLMYIDILNGFFKANRMFFDNLQSQLSPSFVSVDNKTFACVALFAAQLVS